MGCFCAPSFVTVVLVVAILETALDSDFRAAPADSGFFSTLALPPPGWCLMLSVDPILDRMFFRSGAETLLVGRGGLGTVLVLSGALTVDGFLDSGVALDAVVGLAAAGLGLGRLMATPGEAGVPGVVAVGVVVLLFAEFAGALFGRLRSADGDFAVVFLASASFVSVLIDVGLLGGEAAVFLGPDAVVTGDAAVVLGVAGLTFTAARGVVADSGFESEVRLSGLFASVTFGLVSLGVKVEGRVVLVAGRLGVVAEVGPAVGLVGFLFWPGVAEAGRLGLVVDSGLVFIAAGFADGVDAEGLVFFSGLGGSSLFGGAVMSLPVTSSTDFISSGFAVGSSGDFFCGGSVWWS